MSELRDLDQRPFSDLRTTATGDARTVTGRERLEQAIRRRLVTGRGELLHRPGYGCGIMQQLERLNTPDARALLAVQVRAQILQDPDVKAAVVLVRAGVPGDTSRPNAITVEARVQPVGGADETLLFTFSE